MMRFISRRLIPLMSFLAVLGCSHKNLNPIDPYESFNRKIHRFNRALDSAILRPTAKFYRAVIPGPVRASVNNFYNNIYMLPTVANDLLQGKWRRASDDAGRFVVNSTLGLAGLLDVAESYHLPFIHNDLGLTFAHWGDKHSPYIVIPFLGPSTIRDGMSLLFEYAFLSPYPYLDNSTLIYSLAVLRYVDLRSQFLDADKVIDEALDDYSFIRDAYLQRRHFLITGEEAGESSPDELYVDEAETGPGGDYVDE